MNIILSDVNYVYSDTFINLRFLRVWFKKEFFLCHGIAIVGLFNPCSSSFSRCMVTVVVCHWRMEECLGTHSYWFCYWVNWEERIHCLIINLYPLFQRCISAFPFLLN
jgi:hypothetical protein